MQKKSVIIANRHSTSISVEDIFWQQLQKLAKEKGMIINQLVTEIDSKRQVSNLSSAIRIFIVQELLKRLNAE